MSELAVSTVYSISCGKFNVGDGDRLKTIQARVIRLMKVALRSPGLPQRLGVVVQSFRRLANAMPIHASAMIVSSENSRLPHLDMVNSWASRTAKKQRANDAHGALVGVILG